MKVRELIEALIETDPTGDEEVCIDNCDVFFVEKLPAYYDGKLQRLIRDPSNPYYNIIGAKYTSKGFKVNIRYHSIEDAISSNPDLPVDFSEIGGSSQEDYKERVEKWRAETRQIDKEIEEENAKRANQAISQQKTDGNQSGA